ncbi:MULTISPECIES: MmyB family transcriptional regulator [Streptomyces]|uniref:Transcriptional regulator n=1 Tax=Streptomyces tsukubensis (strain DSM 42081 / NBRC 108919 / NRRL 18488 / 9993) TaxID=1114943 RepID=I2N8B7_STRT9|nr:MULTISPECIES: helix-turn-helix domain-containing protein [Streptomyces]AZK97174.1 transcriptional regulator [Streptomyces tsukubensis]EIF93264.1 helix-turn-helix domain-containing protein [Streptomyces tsukubensis NRRL18488]MYS68183.1 helix-turn-helix domain-containing protein [Streptomyces sp. SID5473]QKM66858.1 transcriptional regulator [Streptomyces tsukubensis NRRL18488]TAI44795.1 transcriptional regulator [Streptomyces tsukubensis]
MTSRDRGRSNDLGAFLRARRAEVTPEQVGLPAVGHPRRVAGLRREEVALLAAISTEYYTRLEQGRLSGASAAVLAALAAALRLDDAQTSYLHRLAGRTAAPARDRSVERTAPRVPDRTRLLLDNLRDTPAMVLDPTMSVLAWNTLAAALYGDFSALAPAERNLMRLAFLDPLMRDLYTDWEDSARACVAYVRMDAATETAGPELQALVGELSARDADFRRWWAAHDVAHKTFGTKRYHHPVAGDLTLDWQILALPDPRQFLMVLTAPTGTPSHRALRLLASRASDRPEPDPGHLASGPSDTL